MEFQKQLGILNESEKEVWSFKMLLRYYTPSLGNSSEMQNQMNKENQKKIKENQEII